MDFQGFRANLGNIWSNLWDFMQFSDRQEKCSKITISEISLVIKYIGFGGRPPNPGFHKNSPISGYFYPFLGDLMENQGFHGFCSNLA